MTSTESRLRPSGLAVEAVSSVGARPLRSVLTSLGTVLGVSVLVAVLGITTSAREQIGARFDALASTEITVNQVPGPSASVFPTDADHRAAAINGVTSAGVTWQVADGDAQPLLTLGPWIGGGVTANAPISAASPGLFAEASVQMLAGRTFDQVHQDLHARVAVLGIGLARSLGISSLNPPRSVFIRGVPFVVIGVIADMTRHAELLNSAIIPTTTALDVWGTNSSSSSAVMYVSTRIGAPAVVGQQLAAALRPTAPEAFRIQLPLDPRSLRERIDTDFASLFLILAAVCLLVGVIGIANTTLVSVMERTPEIGLRRTLGALPRHIAWQFLVESALLGLFGGLVGASLGAMAVVAVAIVQSWTAVLPPALPLVGPAIGMLAGILAGAYPALRAAHIEPSLAVRA